MSEFFHIDAQFLRNALGVYEDPTRFELAARSRDARERAANVATLVDALDLCNLLVLGDRIVFDSDVGGGRAQAIFDQIDRVARLFHDDGVADMFRSSFAGVAPEDQETSKAIELKAARGAAAFFPRLARCATNVLDLFHLPVSPPTEPYENLLKYVEAGRPPPADEIEAIASKTRITGRRFYASILSEETAFKALCDALKQVEMTDDVLALLFTNFRLRLAEQRSLSSGKVLVEGGAGTSRLNEDLVYLPAMGRRDFSREFSRFVRWGSDPQTRYEHAFDLGLQEYVLEDWDGIGCQVQLSERRAIPIVVASVLGSRDFDLSLGSATLLLESLRWRSENQSQIRDLRDATDRFEALDDKARQDTAAEYVAEILKSPSTAAARNRALGERLSVRDGWLGLSIGMFLDPLGSIKKLVVGSTDKVREHFKKTRSSEYSAATHLSEAARPLLLGAGADVRQRMIDVFGGTVIDARNPNYDPDRFTATA